MAKGLKLALALGAVALLTATAAFAASDRGTASDTLVYGASADPSLVGSVAHVGRRVAAADRPDLRQPGHLQEGHEHRRAVARDQVDRRARTSLAWTFKLRKGVQFSDGTPFNAAAVCANFTRWYSFPAPLQSDALSYYWQTVFGGFAKPAPGGLGPDKSLYKGCKAHGQYSVSILLRRPSSSFLCGDRPAELRDREPDGAQEVRGGCRHRRRDRRLPSDGHVRDAASDRHRPVHAPVVDAGQQDGARRQPEVLGAEAEDQADHLHPDR